jgi:Tol biopolymer transport system component
VGADWSPDGTRVTFAGRRQLSNGRVSRGLYVVDADGSHLRQISPPGLGAQSAQWSPDGRLIAFSNRSDSTTATSARNVWVVDPRGNRLSNVTASLEGDDFVAPVWSPDSKKLVFNRLGKDGATSLWTANVDGSGLTKLADTPSPAFYMWGTAPTR